MRSTRYSASGCMLGPIFGSLWLVPNYMARFLCRISVHGLSRVVITSFLLGIWQHLADLNWAHGPWRQKLRSHLASESPLCGRNLRHQIEQYGNIWYIAPNMSKCYPESKIIKWPKIGRPKNPCWCTLDWFKPTMRRNSAHVIQGWLPGGWFLAGPPAPGQLETTATWCA